MPLFTIMLEYAGGTYLAQVESSNAGNAVARWAKELPEAVHQATKASREDFATALASSPCEPVHGLRKVWCVSGVVGDQLVLAHVVRTDG